jgi:hypothetical protein
MYKPAKYNSEFCLLIGANPNLTYSKKNIFNLLIIHAKKSNFSCFDFEGKLKVFIQKIHPPGWSGYRKKELMTIINSLMILTIDPNDSKYVVITSSKSNIHVKEIDVIL